MAALLLGEAAAHMKRLSADDCSVAGLKQIADMAVECRQYAHTISIDALTELGKVLKS
jgi:hypothetical protein